MHIVPSHSSNTRNECENTPNAVCAHPHSSLHVEVVRSTGLPPAVSLLQCLFSRVLCLQIPLMDSIEDGEGAESSPLNMSWGLNVGHI